jgi:quinol monooxygenase YgiN
VTEVLLIARHTMKPGTEGTVLPLVEQLVDATRSEPGNLSFDPYRSLSDPTSYVLLERYASREALTAHRATPHFQKILLSQIVPLLAHRAIEEYDVPGPGSSSLV